MLRHGEPPRRGTSCPLDALVEPGVGCPLSHAFNSSQRLYDQEVIRPDVQWSSVRLSVRLPSQDVYHSAKEGSEEEP